MENTFKYFSYGSNMLAERLQARCPSAKLLGTGQAQGYEISFSKQSKDGSGKAMPLATEQAGALLPGVLFEISKEDLKGLDKAEGCGFGYDRIGNFSVYFGAEAEPVEVTTYVANAEYVYPGLQPFDWYLALVIAGAQQHDFSADYIDALRGVARLKDPRLERPVRVTALQAFAKAGIDDFYRLL